MIGVVGISHRTATQDVRQLFSLGKEEADSFARLVLRKTRVAEIVPVSTCHRTELYYYYEGEPCDKRPGDQLRRLLDEFRQVSGDHMWSFYEYTDLQAVKHLFRVISGMDSVVIGEDQVVKQIKDAYACCQEAGLAGVVLMRLFQKSFEAGSRARCETNLQRGPASLSKVAVDLCRNTCPDLSKKNILLIGSGETGRLALHYLVKQGVSDVVISNRTRAHAQALAREYSAGVVPFEQFREALPQSDIVITATAAPGCIINKADIVKPGMKDDGRAQLFIDLSVPRNIDPSVADVKGVRLMGVDDIQPVVDSTFAQRKAGIRQAEEIIDEVAGAFMEWYDGLALRPVIRAIKQNLQKIREDELDIYKQLEDEKKLDVIEEYTDRIAQKYARVFIRNLRDAFSKNPSARSLDLVNEIFKSNE